jgi:hypothetical protein
VAASCGPRKVEIPRPVVVDDGHIDADVAAPGIQEIAPRLVFETIPGVNEDVGIRMAIEQVLPEEWRAAHTH